jgi:iron complex outermembrane recepter protein
MKKASWIFFLILPLTGFCQQKDTSVSGKTVLLNEVIITATKTLRLQNDIPGQNNVIPMQQVQSYPVNNIDDILKTIPNIYINRSTGIFSRNAAVTMRGSDESRRTLVLIDGVPKNKIAGGFVNWSMVNSDEVAQIEITKGPGSALYGDNAMCGVINIITKEPLNDFEGKFGTFYGNYQTIGGTLYLGGQKIPGLKKLFWSVNANYRQGKGINFEDQTGFDPNDTTTYLKEYGATVRLGYKISEKQKIDVVYDGYNEIRGAGLMIYEKDGSYDHFFTQMVRTHYQFNNKKYDVDVHLYWQNEYYYNQNEALNNFTEYKLMETFSNKDDEGILIYVNRKLFKTHEFTFGSDIKSGGVDASDIYRTSTDEISYAGRFNSYALFVQDEFPFLNKHFSIVTGLRLDDAEFLKGSQSVKNPTAATGFEKSYSENFKTNSWINLSPKIAIQYNLNKKAKPYISFSTGFRPANIDDLCKSGKISKGFRLANPDLKPESVYNYEGGLNYIDSGKFTLNMAVYYSDGIDFMYLVNTGALYESADGTIKPVFKRENVSNVHILGAEIGTHFYVTKKIMVFAGYTYNNSKIANFETHDTAYNSNLTGKFLMETSPHMANAGITWQNKYLNSSVLFNYFSSQFLDEINALKTDPYTTVDLKLSKNFYKKLNIYIDIQNLFNVRYIDRKGRYSLGRFVSGGISYKF